MTPLRLRLCCSILLTLGAPFACLAAGDAAALGQAAFERGDYDQALAHFQRAFRQTPGSINLSFSLGLAAMGAGDYETAAAAFDRVLAIDPNLDRAKVELARAYFHMGLYTVSDALFREIADSPETPETVRQNVQHYLDCIGELRRTHRLSGLVTLSAVRDSNARVSPSGPVTIPGLPRLTVPVERDWFLAQSLVLDHDWSSRLQPWGWQSGFIGYNAFYQSEDDLDVTYGRLDSGPKWTVGPWTLGLAANGAAMRKDDERYLTTWGGRAWSALQASPKLSVLLDAAAEERRYWETPGADGPSKSITVRPIWADKAMSLAAEIGMESQDAEDGHESYDRWFAGLTGQLDLGWHFTLLASYQLENWIFEDPGPLAAERRRDIVHAGAIGLRRSFGKRVSAELRHKIQRSSSNQDLHDYTRNVTALNLTYAF